MATTTITTSVVTPTDDRVLILIAAGSRRIRDLRDRCGIAETRLRLAVNRLTDVGYLNQGVFGAYNVTTPGWQRIVDLAEAGLDGRSDTRAAQPDDLDPYTTALHVLWHRRVAAGLFVGSRIGAISSDGHVQRGELILAPGRHVLDDVRRQRRQVAAALERPVEQVAIESHPSQIDSRGEVLLVDESSPLYRVLDHPGSAAYDPATATVTIGLYADNAPMPWPLRNEDGAVNSLVVGAPTVGTSGVLRGVLAAVAGHDTIDARAVDLGGDGGLGIAGTVTATTRSDAVEVLHDVLHAVYQPAPDTPSGRGRLLVLALGDLQVLLADATVLRLVHDIVRQGRKAGVAVIADIKGLSLNEFYQDSLRAALLRGNVALLRGGRRLAVPAALRLAHPDLPERWYTGQSTAGVGQTPSRDALFRTYWTPASR